MTKLPHGALDPKSREEIAKVEIGQTTISPAVERFLFAALLVVCCAVPLFELVRAGGGDEAARRPWTVLRELPARAVDAWRSGRTESRWRALIASNRVVLEDLLAFEASLEDQSRLASVLRPRAQSLLTGTLGAGNEQVYVGRDGWLFYRPDVDSVVGRGFLHPDLLERRITSADEWTTPPQPDPRVAILQFKDRLAAQGITLILLPIPVKPTVHPERLGSGFASFASPPVNPDQTSLLRELGSAGVRVVDPTALLYQTAQGGATQYLGTDTHWRPEAMEMVAQLVADQIRAVDLAPARDPGYRAHPQDVSARGDLFAMLDLKQDQDLVAAETVTIRRVTAADGSPWRSSRDAEILVLGDSFSNIYSLDSMGWGTSAGLVEQLSFALRRPVDRIVQNDAGAYATREILRREWDERLKGKKVVVWQFATRELVFGDWRVY